MKIGWKNGSENVENDGEMALKMLTPSVQKAETRRYKEKLTPLRGRMSRANS